MKTAAIYCIVAVGGSFVPPLGEKRGGEYLRSKPPVIQGPVGWEKISNGGEAGRFLNNWKGNHGKKTKN